MTNAYVLTRETADGYDVRGVFSSLDGAMARAAAAAPGIGPWVAVTDRGAFASASADANDAAGAEWSVWRYSVDFSVPSA